MDADDPGTLERLPQEYAKWRWRLLLGTIVMTGLAVVTHGSTVEIRYDSGDVQPPMRIILALVVVFVAAVVPGLAGAGFALAAVATWRGLGRSIPLARLAWAAGVLGPLPILLVPLSHVFALNGADAVLTSANQVRYMLTVTAPALFGLLPGVLSASLVLKQFLPESRAAVQIMILVAPACVLVYLMLLAAVIQVIYHPDLYAGMMLLAVSPAVPLLVSRQLSRSITSHAVARLLVTIRGLRLVLSLLGLALISRWIVDHPQLASLLGRLDATVLISVVTRSLAAKWLTTVIVTDLLLTMLCRIHQEASSATKTAEQGLLARKLDVLGVALQHTPPPVSG